MDKRLLRVTTHATVGVILWAIKTYGLEKTLEDLHKAHNVSPITPDVKTYLGMLATVSLVSDDAKKAKND